MFIYRHIHIEVYLAASHVQILFFSATWPDYVAKLAKLGPQHFTGPDIHIHIYIYAMYTYKYICVYVCIS